MASSEEAKLYLKWSESRIVYTRGASMKPMAVVFPLITLYLRFPVSHYKHIIKILSWSSWVETLELIQWSQGVGKQSKVVFGLWKSIGLKRTVTFAINFIKKSAFED